MPWRVAMLRAKQLGGDDDVLGGDDVDAVREREPAQIGVQQRHHAADPGHAEPQRQEFRPVRHHQADGVALGDALRQRPSRIAVRPGRQLAIGEPFAVGEQRRRVVVLRRKLVDHHRKDAVRILAMCVVMRRVRSAPRMHVRSAVSRSINSIGVSRRHGGRDLQPPSASGRRCMVARGGAQVHTFNGRRRRTERADCRRARRGRVCRCLRPRNASNSARDVLRLEVAGDQHDAGVRSSSSGQRSSRAGGWITCCTPWITSGRRGRPRRFSRCP